MLSIISGKRPKTGLKLRGGFYRSVV